MEHLGLIGLVIVLAAMTRWFWRAWAVNVPNTPYVYQALVAVGLALGALALLQQTGDAFAPWAVGVALVFLYLTATGAQRIGADAVGTGDVIPAFTAPDDSGEAFDSASLAGSRVLLKFFRGHW